MQFHFEISQAQKESNLKATLLIILFGVIALFLVWCKNQFKKPRYEYRQEFFTENICYVIEKRWFVFYIKLDGEVFLEAHEAELRKQELNNKK